MSLKILYEKIIKRATPFYKKTYSIVSVISTLSVFFTITLFIIGSIIKINVSEDDLLYNDIKKQTPKNSIIASVIKNDIHRFGNDSIIVTAINQHFNFDTEHMSANQLFIYDKVDNDFLKNLYRPFGIGSTYIQKYKLCIDDINSDVMYNDINNIEFAELTGDMFKEIVVTYNSYGGSDGTDCPCIISWIDGSYKVIGTSPDGYFDDMTTLEPLKLGKIEDTYLDYKINYYDKNEKFILNGYLSSYNRYFLDIDGDRIDELIICAWQFGEECNADPHYYRIDVYKPIYNSKSSIPIKWNVIFSKATNEKLDECNLDYVKNFLRNNYILINY